MTAVPAPILPLPLVAIRHDLGMSQAALANLAGFPRSRLSEYETGKVTPAASTLARIEAVLPEDTDIAWGGPVRIRR